MPSNYERIWEVIARIPRGRVATYGQIARLAGLGRRARLVGYALHYSPPDLQLAWHRVINAQGKISFPIDSQKYREQMSILTSEGLVFENGRVDLESYRWRPSVEDFPPEYLEKD